MIPFPMLLYRFAIFYYSITCSHCYHSFMQFLVIQHLQFSISQYPNQWNMLMYRTIQSTINTHYSIFPSTTMININYAQAMLVRAFIWKPDSSLTLMLYTVFNLNQNGTISSWCILFLVMHFSGMDSKNLVIVLYRLVKEKWEIQQ